MDKLFYYNNNYYYYNNNNELTILYSNLVTFIEFLHLYDLNVLSVIW